MYQISRSNTDGSYSVQQYEDSDPDQDDPMNSLSVVQWREIAKRDKEKQRQNGPKILQNIDVPTFHPDGSISYPKGLCLREWTDYQYAFIAENNGKISASKFCQFLIAKAYNQDLPEPLPDDLKRQLSSIKARFNNLLAKKKTKAKVNEYQVRC